MHTWLAGIALLGVAASGCTVHTYSTQSTTPTGFHAQPTPVAHVAPAASPARKPSATVAVAPRSSGKPQTKPSKPRQAQADHGKPSKPADVASHEPVRPAKPAAAKPVAANRDGRDAAAKSQEKPAVSKQPVTTQRVKRESNYDRIVELARRTREQTDAPIAKLQSDRTREDAQNRMAAYARRKDAPADRNTMAAYARRADAKADRDSVELMPFAR